MIKAIPLFCFMAFIAICKGQVVEDAVKIIIEGGSNGCQKDELERKESFLCLANGLEVERSVIQKRGTATREKRWFLPAIFGGLVTCMLVCNQKSSTPPPNKPPTLACPIVTTPQPAYAKRNQVTAVVSWTQPEAYDPEGEDVSISYQPKKYKSGDSFAEGHHSITFIARDAASATDSCLMTFEVKVIHCEPVQWPSNAKLSCEGSSYGKSCTVECLDGYLLQPGDKTTITCEKSGWSRPAKCVAKPCKDLPTIANGRVECSDNNAVYGASCFVLCDDGFKITGPYFLTCDHNGNWETAGNCTDKKPPAFDMTTCPENIVVETDSPNNTALVKWSLPEGRDNTDEEPIIAEINGYTPNTRFSAGSYTLKYTITDREGNVGSPCVFRLRVQSINCDSPNLSVKGAKHMIYECPDRYRYGAECRLSCEDGYPLGGSNKIQCMNKHKDAKPPVLDWDWAEDAPDPYCNETVCPDLRQPLNGATVCDLWTYGSICHIQCEQGYDFAFNIPDIYVCAETAGHWLPELPVPDCNKKLTPYEAVLKSDVYYYTGKCNSSRDNIRHIKQNFIKALNSSNYGAACETFCRGEFVSVKCGPVASRRKRDTYQHHVEKRAADELAYVVEIEFVLSLEKDNHSTAEKIDEMAAIIQMEIDDGQFNIPASDMHTKSDSFHPGVVSLKCPPGTMFKISKGSCAGCPKGMFMSEKKSDCEHCPIGTYQDDINSIACKVCPSQTSTTDVGSSDKEQCRALCDAGYYSSTGLAPCTKCPSTSYQPLKRQIDCLRCPPLTRTLDVGSTSIKECKGYDALISLGKGADVSNITFQSTTATITTWIFLRSFQHLEPVFMVQSTNDVFAVALQDSGQLLLDFNSCQLYTGIQLQKKKWIHLAITLDETAKKVLIYYNGREAYANATQLLQPKLFMEKEVNFSIMADVQLNSFFLLTTPTSQPDIQRYAETCSQYISGYLISQDELVRHSDARSIIPSQCDDVDECRLNPCGLQQCVNKLGEYECICTGGFTGTRCNIPPDFCEGALCSNGSTCITEDLDYKCLCLHGFSGRYCEKKAKNGGWSNWSDWEMCSKTCGGGITTRRRRCDSPPPDPDGQPCDGDDNEKQTCNTDKCPECIELRRTYGLIIHCTETAISKKCKVSCRQGLYFATTPVLEYECGRVTGYEWNHQTSENPTARLPTCSNVTPAERVFVEFEGKYNIDPCNTTTVSLLSTRFEEKLQNTTCLRLGSCEHEVSTTACNAAVRRKRASLTTFTISLKLTLDSSNLEMESLFVNKTAHAGIIKLLQNVNYLERTAQEIYNNSVKFFQVTVHEKSLNPVDNMTVPQTIVACPKGNVRLDVFCAVVPQGSYIDGTAIKPCPRNEYQDLAGQTECKQCPASTSTLGTGSTEASDCIHDHLKQSGGEHGKHNQENDTESEDPNYALHVALGVTVSLLVLILTGIIVFVGCRRFRTNKKTDQG